MLEGSDAYLIRPNHQHKFKPTTVKNLIHEIVREHLSGMQYDPENVPELTRSLAEKVKDKVKNAGFERYKLVVQVLIGEQRGQGVKERDGKMVHVKHWVFWKKIRRMSSRCLWDADTDNYAEDVFMNDSLFCVVAVFGSYYY